VERDKWLGPTHVHRLRSAVHRRSAPSLGLPRSLLVHSEKPKIPGYCPLPQPLVQTITCMGVKLTLICLTTSMAYRDGSVRTTTSTSRGTSELLLSYLSCGLHGSHGQCYRTLERQHLPFRVVWIQARPRALMPSVGLGLCPCSLFRRRFLFASPSPETSVAGIIDDYKS